jgi:hypothetical protein
VEKITPSVVISGELFAIGNLLKINTGLVEQNNRLCAASSRFAEAASPHNVVGLFLKATVQELQDELLANLT